MLSDTTDNAGILGKVGDISAWGRVNTLDWLDREAMVSSPFLHHDLEIVAGAISEHMIGHRKLWFGQQVVDPSVWLCPEDQLFLFFVHEQSDLVEPQANMFIVDDDSLAAVPLAEVTERAVSVEDCGWIAPRPYPFDD